MRKITTNYLTYSRKQTKNPSRLYILGDFNIKEIDWRNNTVHSHNNSYAYKMFDTINQQESGLIKTHAHSIGY